MIAKSYRQNNLKVCKNCESKNHFMHGVDSLEDFCLEPDVRIDILLTCKHTYQHDSQENVMLNQNNPWVALITIIHFLFLLNLWCKENILMISNYVLVQLGEKVIIHECA